jgi:hypothetical protein
MGFDARAEPTVPVPRVLLGHFAAVAVDEPLDLTGWSVIEEVIDQRGRTAADVDDRGRSQQSRLMDEAE